MRFSVTNTQQLGKIAQLVRKTQGLDQITAAALSSNGTTFMSDFENGKPTSEVARVLRVLDSLGIKVHLDIPVEEEELTKSQKNTLQMLIQIGEQ